VRNLFIRTFSTSAMLLFQRCNNYFCEDTGMGWLDFQFVLE
jgi:hypothetical protein